MSIRNSKYGPLRTDFKILTLEDNRSIMDLYTLHKTLNSYMDSLFLLSAINLRIPGLRDASLFNIPYRRTNAGQNSPITRIQETIKFLSYE